MWASPSRIIQGCMLHRQPIIPTFNTENYEDILPVSSFSCVQFEMDWSDFFMFQDNLQILQNMYPLILFPKWCFVALMLQRGIEDYQFDSNIDKYHISYVISLKIPKAKFLYETFSIKTIIFFKNWKDPPNLIANKKLPILVFDLTVTRGDPVLKIAPVDDWLNIELRFCWKLRLTIAGHFRKFKII